MFKIHSPTSCEFLIKLTDPTKGKIEYHYHYEKLLKSSNLISLKLNLTEIAKTFPKVSAMTAFIGIFRIPKDIKNLKFLLCKLSFEN